MALITCPECNKEVSDTAKICPNCGKKLKTKTFPKYTIPITIVFAFIIIFVAIYISANTEQYNLSSDAKSYGIEALGVADKYINGIIDYDSASNQLDKIRNKILDLPEVESMDNSALSTDILIFSSSILTGTQKDVIDNRNTIASAVGKKKISY